MELEEPEAKRGGARDVYWIRETKTWRQLFGTVPLSLEARDVVPKDAVPRNWPVTKALPESSDAMP